MNRNFYLLSVICILSFFAFNAHTVYAAEVYFAPHAGPIYVGDTVVFEARVSSPDVLINVADGAFLFDADILEATRLSTGGSIFSLWANKPSFSSAGGRASFVGGVPDGFKGSDGLMVKAIFRAKKEGETTLSFESGFALLLNDGKGTSVRPQTRSLTLTVAALPPQTVPKDEWKNLIETDTTPPEFVEAIISRDSRYFDGTYFASFFATDTQSGVVYYEIKEGVGAFVRAVSPSILQNQTPGETVQIKAIDGVGNERVMTIEYPSTLRIPSYTTMLFWIVAVLVLAISAGALFFRLRRKI